jgi:hypothetical protein
MPVSLDGVLRSLLRNRRTEVGEDDVDVALAATFCSNAKAMSLNSILGRDHVVRSDAGETALLSLKNSGDL